MVCCNPVPEATPPLAGCRVRPDTHVGSQHNLRKANYMSLSNFEQRLQCGLDVSFSLPQAALSPLRIQVKLAGNQLNVRLLHLQQQ